MRLFAPLLVAVVAAGCLHLPATPDVSPDDPPMQAWIGFPAGSSTDIPLFVNRDAYVALFEILPGRGATLLYPHTERMTYAHDVHFVNMSFQPGRALYGTAAYASADHEPRYYYLIASAAPLDLARLQSSLGGIRRVLGRQYLAYRPYDVIDRLTSAVVPRQPDEDWATDLLIDWPAPPVSRALALRYVQCANGRVLVVPANYPFFGCPGDPRAAVVARAAPDTVAVTSVPVSERRPRLPEVSDAGHRAIEPGPPEDVKQRRAEGRARRPIDHVTRRPMDPDTRRPIDLERVGVSDASSPAPARETSRTAASSKGQTSNTPATPESSRSSEPVRPSDGQGKERKPEVPR